MKCYHCNAFLKQIFLLIIKTKTTEIGVSVYTTKLILFTCVYFILKVIIILKYT